MKGLLDDTERMLNRNATTRGSRLIRIDDMLRSLFLKWIISEMI